MTEIRHSKQGPRTNRAREEGEKGGFEINVVVHIIKALECKNVHKMRAENPIRQDRYDVNSSILGIEGTMRVYHHGNDSIWPKEIG